MPGNTESMFYSLDLGPVHFVIVSTGRSKSNAYSILQGEPSG